MYNLQPVTVQNDLAIEKWKSNLRVLVATGGNEASIVETILSSLSFGPDMSHIKEWLGVALDEDLEQWLKDPPSPSSSTTSTTQFVEPSSGTINAESSKQDSSMLLFSSLSPVQDASDMKRTTTGLEDTLSTWKGKDKNKDDVDADIARHTGSPRSGSLSLHRPVNVAAPATSQFVNDNQTTSGSTDSWSTSSIRRNPEQVLGKRRRSADEPCEEKGYPHAAVASNYSLPASQNYDHSYPTVQGAVYPAYDQHPSLRPRPGGAADFARYQGPPSFGFPSNPRAYNDAAYLHSMGFEGPRTSQRPIYPLPQSGHLRNGNQVPLAPGWNNSHGNANNHGFAASHYPTARGMSHPNGTHINGRLPFGAQSGYFSNGYEVPPAQGYNGFAARQYPPRGVSHPNGHINGPPPFRAQSGYFSNGNEVPLAQGWPNSQNFGGFAAPQYPTAPGIAQPNGTHINSPHRYGMISQPPYHPQRPQYGTRSINMTPSSVYPTHAQHHTVGQNVDSRQAPSNVVRAPRFPDVRRITSSTSTSPVSKPDSSSSGTSGSESYEPEEILFVTEDVICKWVISEPGEPIITCDRLMKPDENPADHVRQFHPPEYRRGTHEWYCKWLTCQKWTTAALKRHLEADNHTQMGRRVCGRCGKDEPRFERIKKDHVNCMAGTKPKLRKKRRVEA